MSLGRQRFVSDSLPEAELTKTLRLTATSVNDPTISDTGEATYLVGRQGTIDLTPPDPISIDEAEPHLTMEITVRTNSIQSFRLHKPSQSTRLMVIGQNTLISRLMTMTVSFSLESDESRKITVEIEVSEATLLNLPSDSLTVNFTIYATSLTVADSPTAKLTVVLQKQSPSTADDGVSSEDDSELVKNIVLWSGFLDCCVSLASSRLRFSRQSKKMMNLMIGMK